MSEERELSEEKSVTAQTYLDGLYQAAVDGNLRAGSRLSRIAAGGLSQRARQLVDRLDEVLSPRGGKSF